MASSMRKHDRVEKEPRQKQIDKINRFSYPKTMRELDSLAPSDFSENCPVFSAPDFSFIPCLTRMGNVILTAEFRGFWPHLISPPHMFLPLPAIPFVLVCKEKMRVPSGVRSAHFHPLKSFPFFRFAVYFCGLSVTLPDGANPVTACSKNAVTAAPVSRGIKQVRPVSKPAIRRISLSVSVKSKISRFSFIRCGLEDLTSGATPRCVNQRSTTCAAVFLCAAPISQSVSL